MTSTSSTGCFSTVTLRIGIFLIVYSFVFYTFTLYSFKKILIEYGMAKQLQGEMAKSTEEQDKQISINDLYQTKRLNLNPRHICNCTDRIEPTASKNWTKLVESSCSDEATLLGKFQNVVSYSLYQSRKPNKLIEFDTKYFFGVAGNAEGVKKFYPGWVMRIYSNIQLEPRNKMCSLICADPIIYFCDTRRLPGGLGNVKGMDPMRWRDLPLGDGTVEKFLVRDLDSRISQRERDAVSDWEASNFSFHSMRDNRAHKAQIMGGMWGGNNTKIGFKIARNLQTSIVKTRETGNDQHILTSIIYRNHKKNILTHDSYLCEVYKDSRPFPSQRENKSSFVGKRVTHNKPSQYKLPKCPPMCRPRNHQDWEYC